MPNPLKNFLDKVRRPLAKAVEPAKSGFITESELLEFGEKDESSASLVTHEYLEHLTQELKKIKVLLMLSMVEKETAELKLPGAPDPFAPPEKPKEAPADGWKPTAMADRMARLRVRQDKGATNLEKDTTGRINPKTKRQEFLLHRATADGEYEVAADPVGSSEVRTTHYEPKRETVWFVEFRSAEAARVAANPVVSCWIPEEQIASTAGQRADAAGAWGDMGASPFKEEIKVTVKPGSYAIHSELKKSRAKR